jgi:CheY-like chemotaxis protein
MREFKYDVKRGVDIYHSIFGSLLQNWIVHGKANPSDLMVWRSGLSGWRKAKDLEELIPFFKKRRHKSIKVIPLSCKKRKIEKILIIDDELDLCILLSDFLKIKGYNVLNANTMRKAFNQLGKEVPDMILLDLKLPDGDGMSIISKIKKICPQTAICVASAYGTDEKKLKALQLGAFSFVDKPFTGKEILSKIKLVTKLETIKI